MMVLETAGVSREMNHSPTSVMDSNSLPLLLCYPRVNTGPSYSKIIWWVLKTQHNQRECCCLVAQLCLTLWDPMDSSPPGSSIHGNSQARILERGAISFSRGSSWPRDWTCVSCIDRQILYPWAIQKAQERMYQKLLKKCTCLTQQNCTPTNLS